MGYSIAQSVIDRGGNVILISGPTNLPLPYGACHVPVMSAQDMFDAVHAHVGSAQAIVMTSAVADFRPARQSTDKIKKQDGQEGLVLELARNPDIIGSLRDADLLRIGFAAETSDHVVHGTEKLSKKNLDMVIVNDAVDTIGAPNSTATIVAHGREPEVLPKLIKERLAAVIVEHMCALLKSR
jgi:phosphopantothenoylcysteine decarboxylase/phosphopantothenate--cysteine ligase